MNEPKGLGSDPRGGLGTVTMMCVLLVRFTLDQSIPESCSEFIGPILLWLISHLGSISQVKHFMFCLCARTEIISIHHRCDVSLIVVEDTI